MCHRKKELIKVPTRIFGAWSVVNNMFDLDNVDVLVYFRCLNSVNQ